jgi:hypothetical protein
MSFSEKFCGKSPFRKAGMKHYTVKEHKGKTHKMDDGSLHTGATHTEGSEKLVHGPFKKTVSWKYGKGTYSGTLIPGKETKTHRYARTHNGKIKSLPKNK